MIFPMRLCSMSCSYNRVIACRVMVPVHSWRNGSIIVGSARKTPGNVIRVDGGNHSFDRAADEVYAYQHWDAVFQKVYGEKFELDSKIVARRKGTDGAEKDGQPRGGGGEGKNHKALRLWVCANPDQVAPRLGNVETKTEVVLPSGDRVDVVYYSKQTLAVEVKSRDSNEADIERGIYQCVKYEAVLRAQDPRTNPDIRSLLVTEEDLEPVLRDLAKKLGIRHRVVPQNR